VTLDHLRSYALARSLFAPTSLARAIHKLGFVQADPIRAPARAQDLTLRHRVKGYRAGDLERRYARLAIEEDYFVNYGFLPRATQRLMHPRSAHTGWPRSRWAQAHAVLEFVRERGVVHPAEVDAHFQHGKTRNWFGGSTNASTQLLDGMHYRGLLRIAARQGGVRLYAASAPNEPHEPHEPHQPHQPATDPDAAMDALVDVVLRKYAPLPLRSMSELISHLRLGAPQWAERRRGALQRARARLPHAQVDGLEWYWPAGENPSSRRHQLDEDVRLLAPFDPIVWDRRRFELFWRWAYRFEAYTPAAQRVRGYYALPLLWRGSVIGWANAAVRDGQLRVEPGFVSGRAPRDASFAAALDAESERLSVFLGLGTE
jgi:uncharacterized protein YcaQ